MRLIISILLILAIVGCSSNTAEQPSQDNPGVQEDSREGISEQTPTEDVSEEQVQQEVDQGIDDLDTLETDLDLSDLESLEQDLAALDNLNF